MEYQLRNNSKKLLKEIRDSFSITLSLLCCKNRKEFDFHTCSVYPAPWRQSRTKAGGKLQAAREARAQEEIKFNESPPIEWQATHVDIQALRKPNLFYKKKKTKLCL